MPKGHSLTAAYAAQARRGTPSNYRYLYVTGRYNGNTNTIKQREYATRTTVPQLELDAFATQIRPLVSAPTTADVTITYYFASQ